jgi:hypothetical protein
MKRVCAALALISLSFVTHGQSWRGMRHEVYAGVGVSNFLGDLGGARGDASHTIKDLRMSATRPTMQGGYKFMALPVLSVKGQLTWGYLSGDDAKTKNLVRNTRNLSFRSVLWEFSAMAQYYPLQERIHPRYKIRGVNGNKTFSVMPYVFTGFGFALFNPKAKYMNDWVALQPLGTEGQGLAGRPDRYKRITLALPFGMGLKYLVDKVWAISFELSVRYTLSDYIDDVSTTYYHPDQIDAAYGAPGGALSDRAIDPDNGITGVVTYNNGMTNYLQRGDPRWNDAYMFAIFSAHYRINKGTTYIPKF